MFGQLLTPILRKHAPGVAMATEDEMPFHSQQKEKRIIGDVEPVLNMHRIVLNASILDKDAELRTDVGEEKGPEYQFFNQLTRINYDRGCLKHDDRLDAFSMAVAHAQRGMGLDPEQQAAEREAANFEEEMSAYITGERIFGRSITWSSSYEDSSNSWI